MEDALQVLRQGQDDGLHVLPQPGQSPWTHREVLLLCLSLQSNTDKFSSASRTQIDAFPHIVPSDDARQHPHVRWPILTSLSLSFRTRSTVSTSECFWTLCCRSCRRDTDQSGRPSTRTPAVPQRDASLPPHTRPPDGEPPVSGSSPSSWCGTSRQSWEI